MELEWVCTYNDGTELSRYNDNGTENKYPDIDRTRIVSFSIALPQLDKNNKKTLLKVKKLDLKNGDIFFYRRVTAMVLMTTDPTKITGLSHFYVFGKDQNNKIILDSEGHTTSHPSIEKSNIVIKDYETPVKYTTN